MKSPTLQPILSQASMGKTAEIYHISLRLGVFYFKNGEIMKVLPKVEHKVRFGLAW